jgi:heme-degrading monooxygenase HmoA
VKSALLLLPCAACALSTPFSGPGFDEGLVTDAPGPFVAVATHTRASRGMGGAFDDHVSAVTDQLATQPGFVGGSLRGRLLGREAWTLTVWEDEESLADFVSSGAHLEAMNDAPDVIDGVYYASWSVARDEMPPSWDDALDHLADAEPDHLW